MIALTRCRGGRLGSRVSLSPFRIFILQLDAGCGARTTTTIRPSSYEPPQTAPAACLRYLHLSFPLRCNTDRVLCPASTLPSLNRCCVAYAGIPRIHREPWYVMNRKMVDQTPTTLYKLLYAGLLLYLILYLISGLCQWHWSAW